MAHEVRAWLGAAALVAGLVSGAGAQPPPPPPPTAVTSCPGTCVTPVEQLHSPDPRDMLAPALDPAMAPPPEACCEDRNGRLLVGDPFLDPGRFPAPGLNAAAQISILSPFYKNKIVGPVTVPGVGTSSISVPTAT